MKKENNEIKSSAHSKYRCQYVCVIMDAFTKEVLACVCSTSCETDFILDAVDQLIKKHGADLKTDVLIHSDQGCQYTSSRFVTVLNDYGLRQSMSRRGNCWDNAPQESLFGHMKDEVRTNATDGHDKIERRSRAVNEKRRNTPCFFRDGLSRDTFEEIVNSAGRKIKRVKSV